MRQYLIEMAKAARLFLEPIWAEWHTEWGSEPPQPLSRNTCGRSSLFIVKALQHEGVAAAWKTGVPRHSENGPELGTVGFFVNSRWESHSWAEAGNYIVDVTADQFGAPSVLVVPVGDERYCATNEDPTLPAYVTKRAIAVASIWPRWLKYKGLECRPAIVS